MPGNVARSVASALAVLVASFGTVLAEPPSGPPITIGFSMPLTGGLAVNGTSGLLAMQIWAEDTNEKGGLLGRPVKLVYYDDQTNPSLVPGITQNCSTSIRSISSFRPMAPMSRPRRCRS